MKTQQQQQSIDLSVILPTINEANNLPKLISQLREVFKKNDISCEIIIVDGHSTDGTVQTANELGARTHIQINPGYGSALLEGFALIRGEYVLTMDADCSHNPIYFTSMWPLRDRYDVVVGSRYSQSAGSYAPMYRRLLSFILNFFFKLILGLPVSDSSSGFRLYRTSILNNLKVEGRNYDALQEILVRLVKQGASVTEIPIFFEARNSGISKANPIGFAAGYLTTLWRLWNLKRR